uniref:Uncharacterized protein n=1 Tax=wastewater metagenome TaxID=527639 RepID=A0A0A8KXX0_9ZZZZ
MLLPRLTCTAVPRYRSGKRAFEKLTLNVPKLPRGILLIVAGAEKTCALAPHTPKGTGLENATLPAEPKPWVPAPKSVSPV